MEDLALILSRYIIILYPILGLGLTVFYLGFPKTEKKVLIITECANIFFGIWLLIVVAYSLIQAKKDTGYLFYEDDLSERLFYISVAIILIAICFRKIRRSPFSILSICVILFINYLLAMATFKVEV